MNADIKSRCGYVAVVGRPNVGKSTLINHILGQKLNITSRKPQTTRHTLLGIKTEDHCQALYVDTPGMHSQQARAINRLMNRSAESVLNDVNVIVMVVDRIRWTEEDQHVLEKLRHVTCPVLLAINKVDLLEDKATLLPFIAEMNQRFTFADIVPLSALAGAGIDDLEQVIKSHLPEGPRLYDADQLTDRSERFLVAEIVREKVMRQLGDEIPYSTMVEIAEFKEEEGLIRIYADILVEKEGQKAIVIGKQGSRLKLIGTEARKDIQALLQKKVMLKLWVKVKSGWADDERALRSLGFQDP